MEENMGKIIPRGKMKPLERTKPVLNKTKIANITIQALSILGIVLTVVFFVWAFKHRLFTDAAALERYMNGIGPFAPIIFILIQIVQTVIPIIPGALTCPAGAMIFGHLNGFIYNYIGIMIGSIMNFFLARRYGKPLVQAVTSKRAYEKYMGSLERGNSFEKVFTFGMFFPVSPADLLCMMAGISNMEFKRFLLILSIGKPITLLLYTLGITEVIRFFGRIIIGG